MSIDQVIKDIELDRYKSLINAMDEPTSRMMKGTILQARAYVEEVHWVSITIENNSVNYCATITGNGGIIVGIEDADYTTAVFKAVKHALNNL